MCNAKLLYILTNNQHGSCPQDAVCPAHYQAIYPSTVFCNIHSKHCFVSVVPNMNIILLIITSRNDHSDVWSGITRGTAASSDRISIESNSFW